MSKNSGLQSDYKDLLELTIPLVNKIEDDALKKLSNDWLAKLDSCPQKDSFVRNQYILLLCLQLSRNYSLDHPFIEPPPEGNLPSLGLKVGSTGDYKVEKQPGNTNVNGETSAHTDDYVAQDSSHERKTNFLKSLKTQLSCSSHASDEDEYVKSVDDPNKKAENENFASGKTPNPILKSDDSITKLSKAYKNCDMIGKQNKDSIEALKQSVESHIELLNRFQKVNNEMLSNYRKLIAEIEIKEQKLSKWTNTMNDTFIRLVKELQSKTNCENQECIDLKAKVQEFEKTINSCQKERNN